MPMFPWGRYRYCVQTENEDGILRLDERESFRYKNEPDNRNHRSRSGDFWWGLAHMYFQGIPRPCGLWWLLCEFQPVPVIDPTIVIPENTLIVVPSLRLVRLEVFSEERRKFH
ncbi:MAG: hypothetical protein KAV87_05365 [Desulfobacteraceae bacterium]|nr:hypothetical protein [Desulfobacteraceae bacterium]